MVNNFPTKFCLRSGLTEFLPGRGHSVLLWLGSASAVPSAHGNGHWKGFSSCSPGQLCQTLDFPWPLCQLSSAGTLSPSVPGGELEAVKLCGAAAPKPQDQPWPFGLEVHAFFFRLPAPQVLSLRFPGSSCVQVILSEIAWERNKCRQNNKYTCIGLPFLAGRRCFGT